MKGRCETGPCAGSPALLRKCLVQLSRVFCTCGHVVHDLVNEQDETWWGTWINCPCSRGCYFINACVSYSFCQPLEDFCNCSVISKDLYFDTDIGYLFHRGICLRDWSLNGIVLLVCSFPQITTPKPLTCGPLGASLLRCWLEKHSLQVLKHCFYVFILPPFLVVHNFETLSSINLHTQWSGSWRLFPVVEVYYNKLGQGFFF